MVPVCSGNAEHPLAASRRLIHANMRTNKVSNCLQRAFSATLGAASKAIRLLTLNRLLSVCLAS